MSRKDSNIRYLRHLGNSDIAIFLDIVMPDADGGAVAAEINADPVLQGTPIVFLTALVSQAETAGGQGLIDGHPFLAKPVDPDAVIACIEKHARR